ncbi:MAG: TolC family protein [Alphaproteobacteria bacterium]|nr:TolC family protein [Alphaproteobacteria bacterium]MBU1768983.1 TolC family protein [Alphaproteobacteria bacterium]
MSKLFPLFALAGAALLSACAPSVALRAPELALPATYNASPVSGDAELAILDRWWLLFSDAQLDELIERALERNTDARLAQARLLEARAIRRAALSRFRVQGDLTGNASAQGTEVLGGVDAVVPGAPGAGGVPFIFPGTFLSTTAGLNVSYELDLFGRREAARSGADADLLAARFAAEASRSMLAADVADNLFAARALAVQQRDAEAGIGTAVRLREALVVRVARGIAADAELARVDTDLRTLRAQAAGVAGELDAARRALLVLTGAPDAPLVALPITGDLADPPTPPMALPGELLRRRPDVREAEARLRAAAARTALARLELFPRLTLNPGGALTKNFRPESLLTATWNLAAGLAVPILDRPRLLAELEAEGARAEQAAIGYERAVQIAFSEADGALVRLAADRARVRELAEGARRAAVARNAAGVLYGRGLQDLTTLLDAERAERAAREALSAARADTLRRTVTAFRALGGGWSPDTYPATER